MKVINRYSFRMQRAHTVSAAVTGELSYADGGVAECAQQVANQTAVAFGKLVEILNDKGLLSDREVLEAFLTGYEVAPD